MNSPKRARQCIFCSNPGGSKEHLWPEWMHPHLEPSPEGRYHKELHTFSPFEGKKSAGRRNATGSTHNIQVRAVCDPCNNGWMNRLEGEARPFLEPLVAGEPIALDWEQQEVVARWVTLKSLVMEHAQPDCAVTTRYYREMFRFRQEIPHYFRIYLASHDLQPSSGLYRQSRCMSVNSDFPDPPLGGVSKNIQSIVFRLGRVFAVVHAARINGFQIEDKVAIPALYDTSRIWPPDHAELVWPRKPVFGKKHINEISTCLDRMTADGRVVWVKDVPEN